MLSFNFKKALYAANGSMLLDIGFELNKGSFLAIYGASGAGKTTILRILAGLMVPDDGIISFRGESWLDTTQNKILPPQKRGIGFVFQDFALFPNRTVRGNLDFALAKGQPKTEIDELVSIMGLEELQKRYPSTLSGGQQQRVALARALVQRPKLLLLDEPMSAFGNEMRASIQNYILELHKKYNLTTILVSHDIAEIYKMADRVLVLNNGVIEKSGTPNQVFTNSQVSSKFQMIGTILEITLEDIAFLVSVLVNGAIIKVIASKQDLENISIGDKVLVASKAFNPIIIKIT